MPNTIVLEYYDIVGVIATYTACIKNGYLVGSTTGLDHSWEILIRHDI